jgi:hypothetical protein
MVDSKRYVFGRARTENGVPEGRKARASSRTPNGVIYRVTYTKA